MNLNSNIFIFNKPIKLTEQKHLEILKTIYNFSGELNKPGQSVDHYIAKRGAIREKGKKDIELGKMGEEYTKEFLNKINVGSYEVDYEIRKGKNKGWSKDLGSFHVKTCDVGTTLFMKKNGINDKYSWLFNYKDSHGYGGKDVIFNDENCTDIVVFVYTRDIIKSRTGIIVATAPWNILCERKLLEEPIKNKNIKRAVYYNSLLGNKVGVVDVNGSVSAVSPCIINE